MPRPQRLGLPSGRGRRHRRRSPRTGGAPIDSIRRPNPRRQGLVGLGDAIAWFCREGWDVLLPLNDSQKYDLAVQAPDGRLQRVQVKTTTARRNSSWIVDLRTNGGNRSRRTVEPFDPGTCELLYVLTDDGDRFLIPTAHISATTTIALGVKWASYRC